MHSRKVLLLSVILILLFASSEERIHASVNPTIQWNLLDVGTASAWNITQGSPDVVVAVIDSGVDITHPDLVNQCWVNIDEIPDNGKDDDNNGYIDDLIGWDFRDYDNNPIPGHNHGTKVAALIVADDDNDLLVGVAPKIKIMPIRFLDNNNAFGPDDWGIFNEAIDYAVDNGADIIQMSIQANGIPPTSFYNSVKRAYNFGVIIISVTGNKVPSHQYGVTYPGKYPEVIAVSATTKNHINASFSLTGDENEICAPGENIYFMPPYFVEDDPYFDGTSFAAPLVSGAIALMLSINNTLSIEEVRSILHNTSTDLGPIGKDPYYGYGLLNVSKAVEYVASITNTSLTTTVNSSSDTMSSDPKTSLISGFDLTVSLVCLCVAIIEKKKPEIPT